MNEKEKKEFKEKLNEVFEQTKSRIADLKELTKPIAPENAIGRISRMDAINNKSVNEAALRVAEAKMSNLKVAFDKVDAEGFDIMDRKLLHAIMQKFTLALETPTLQEL